jgi:tripartite-type tricarboxylate transporter receptor subunit TctC
MRALAVTSARRDPVLPDTMTMIEAGFPGFDLGNWLAIVGPANIPKDIVVRLNSEVAQALNEPATREKIAAQGFNVVTSTPEEAAGFIRSEHEKWAKLVKMSGAKVD